MKIQQKDFTFLSPADGIRLEGTFIFPPQPKGIVQFIHGMAEHKARYFGLMTALAEAGYATVIHNHRGHGNCPIQGYFGKAGAEGMLRDAKEVTRLAKQEFPALPLYLFGHSMGSLVARCYLKRWDEELSGLLICGTPYAAPAAIRGGLMLIRLETGLHGEKYRSALINRLIAGSFNKAVPHAASPNQWISCNEENVAAFDADPQCGFCFTLNGFKGLMQLMKEAYSPKNWALKNTGIKVHLLSGEEDPCHGGKKNFMKVFRLINEKGYAASWKLFPQMRHEIFQEKERGSVIRHILGVLEDMEKQ